MPIFIPLYHNLLIYVFLYEIFALREILACHYISCDRLLHSIVIWFDKQRLLLKLSIDHICKWSRINIFMHVMFNKKANVESTY